MRTCAPDVKLAYEIKTLAILILFDTNMRVEFEFEYRACMPLWVHQNSKLQPITNYRHAYDDRRLTSVGRLSLQSALARLTSTQATESENRSGVIP
jgi:hypothetical protein